MYFKKPLQCESLSAIPTGGMWTTLNIVMVFGLVKDTIICKYMQSRANIIVNITNIVLQYKIILRFCPVAFLCDMTLIFSETSYNHLLQACGNYAPNFLHSILNFSQNLFIMLNFILLCCFFIIIPYLLFKLPIKVSYISQLPIKCFHCLS